jgi:diguanylate cyclase
MPIATMPHEAMHAALSQLDQALYNHEQWCEAIYATLICRLAPDERDVDAHAHRNCRFGQWLYGPGKAALQRHPGMAAVAAEHERMHRGAATMLLAAGNRVPITIADFDRFAGALKRMRLEVLTLKQELEEALYNLDPLTGAANRIGMLTRLREQQEMVRRKVHPCCIAMMDLDLFKTVNDTYGHPGLCNANADVMKVVAAPSPRTIPSTRFV